MEIFAVHIGEFKRFCCFCLCLAVLLSGGCSDSPDKQAVKELHSHVDKALELAGKEGEFDKARDEIRKALRNRSRIGDAADPAILTSANFAYARGQDLLLELDDYARNVDTVVEQIGSAVSEINALQIEQGQIEGILAGMEQEAAELEGFINNAQGDQPSLKDRLAAVSAQLANLESQKAVFEEEMGSAQESAAKIERQAQEKFRQAELATGEERAQLEREGYALLLAKKVVDEQDAMDSIKAVDEQIAIVSPLVEKLSGDLQALHQKINGIRNSAEQKDLRSQLTEIKGQLSGYSRGIDELSKVLGTAQSAYRDKLDETISEFEQASKDYKSLKSKSNRDLSGARQADSYFWAGSALVKGLGFERNVAQRISSMALVADGSAATSLKQVSSDGLKTASSCGEKGMEYLTRCVESYAKLEKGARGEADFTEGVMKSHVVALFARMALAEELGDETVAEESFNESQRLLAKVNEIDAGFSELISARLLGTEHTPLLAVDRTAYYDGLQQQLEGWDELKGEARESKIRELLAALEEARSGDDPAEFDRVMGQEQEQLQEALDYGLKHGFEVVASKDPNDF